MNHSLNEIEALSKRAARGAGLSWGLAEEASKAVRWLASHGLPGPVLLADVLTLNDQAQHCNIAPVSLDGPWHAPSGPLCPLVSGACLNDCAARLSSGQPLHMTDVSYPLLIVPFAAWAALHLQAPVRVSWLDLHIDTDGSQLWIDDPKSQIEAAFAPQVTCQQTALPDTTAQKPAPRGTLPEAVGQRLTLFAKRTYAPSTEQSRLLGAGAGVNDND